MEKPVHKIEIEYINPTNIEAEVPGKHELREGTNDLEDLDNTNPEDLTLSPVITVTKQESEFTKGDLKLQKVSITEDIADDTNGYYTNPNINADVIKGPQPMRAVEDDRRTRIPTLKNRQGDSRQRRESFDKKDEIPPPRLMQKRSSIPRLKDSKIPPPLDRRESKTDLKPETPQIEDEFEKIYDEVIVSDVKAANCDPKEAAIDSLDIKNDDLEKLENKFEEIIHDYEEHKVEPITVDLPVEKPKYSKIPLSKRKSDQEIKVSKPVERNVVKKDEVKPDKVETRIPVHKSIPHIAVRTKYNTPKAEDRPNDVNLNKISVNKPEPKEISIKPKVIEVKVEENIVTPKPSMNGKPVGSEVNPKLISEPILQESVVVNETKLDNANEKLNDNETDKTDTIPKDNTDTILKDNTDTIPKDNTDTIPKDNTDTIPKDNLDFNDENMDKEYTPGKVSRLLKKLRSREFDSDIEPKKEVVLDIPKKKSVFSKIAMFERQKSEEAAKPKLPISKPPKIKPKDLKIFKSETVDNTPIIVDELLKEVYTDSIVKDIEAEDSLNNDKESISYEEIRVNQDELKTNANESINGQIVNDNVTTEDDVHSMILTNDSTEPSTNEITKPILTELLAPPTQIIDENVFKENNDILKPNDYEIKPEEIITNESISPNIEKEYIPIENITLLETKIETVKLKPAKYNREVDNTDDVFPKESKEDKWRRINKKGETDRQISVADDLGDAVKGKVSQIIVRMNSMEKIDNIKKEINPREKPRTKSVSRMIALFEQKSVKSESPTTHKPDVTTKSVTRPDALTEEAILQKTAELANGKLKYGRVENMTYMVLSNGVEMPVIALGTALLDNRLIRPVVEAAIDMGYRAIDTAYIYGNEKEVGAAIRAKIDDGTVSREDLFIISKLWSTFHRPELVSKACLASLQAMGLKYFDLYLIHNPMSFKEGPDPIPKIANVVQYSSSDFMDAWYGMEGVVAKGMARSIGVSNFNSQQIQRVMDKGRVKPVINQVECHPYLSQEKLDKFCSARDIRLSCFGVLGSKGTPVELTSGLRPVIDDALLQVLAAARNVTPAQMLIRYQIDNGHNVVVKASSAAHLWDNLRALELTLDAVELNGMHGLNRNKRIYTFAGMGDTHRNYPFRIQF